MTSDARSAARSAPHPVFTIRPVADGEWEAWEAIDALAFGEEEPPEHREFGRAIREPERCIGVFDGARPVGSSASFGFSMTVPGGAAVPVAGVTAVGMLPTHRRRGALRAMMRYQLDDLYENGGEAVAALTASEPAIYGRFGYGLATWAMSLRSSRVGDASGLPRPDPAVRLRLADPLEALPDCLKVFRELAPTRPGFIARTGAWERRKLLDAPDRRNGASPLRCVVAERDGHVRGYAYYATAASWTAADNANGTTRVRECLATDPATRVALWRYLFDLDLMRTVAVASLPVDDPLLHLLADPRAAEPALSDDLFVRLVDVGRALASRTYAAPVDLVLEVADEFCPWNAGRWRLSGDASGARCERTSDAADVALDVRELGSLFLGGVSASALAGAGRIDEVRAGAVGRLGRAFRSDVAPWLSMGF